MDSNEKKKSKCLPKFKVILVNDEFNSFENVINSLKDVIGIDEITAGTHAKETHELGSSLIAIAHEELAETYVVHLHEKGLQVRMEPTS